MYSASNFLIARIKPVSSPRKSLVCPARRFRSPFSKLPHTAPAHKIELLEYRAPKDRKRIDVRPCDVGSAHVAFTVDNLDAVLKAIAASGWRTAGKPQTLSSGPNAGKRVIYVRDPDGTTIEFMQPP